ncbi:MAG TPA: GNAT family N-acetyltransferase [Pirellulales bacterium]|jgi:RimJ/RimL family protein N-acetyltransferase|nr:GNAT family N-acetyltransferase [Pirellulales bacterium]
MLIAETERTILRHFHVADLDAIAAVFGDPEVMRFGQGPKPREWVEKWLKGCLEDYYQKWGFGLWAVVYRPSNAVIGYCGLTLFEDVDGLREIEIGYRLARDCWGQGLATEAARAVRDHALGQLSLRRLIALIDAKNVRSIRVAEKIGLRHEKATVFRGKAVGVYAIHSSD